MCGKNFKCGIWCDMEDADGYKQSHGNPDNETLINICYNFCEKVENAGYYVGIYANLYWLQNKINDSKLDRFDKWVAQWNNVCTYNKIYSIWQNTSNLMINGKRFDGNYLKRNFFTNPNIVENNKTIDDLANEVINGQWGNGQERIDRLSQAGYDYNVIQNRVNEIIGSNKEYYIIQRGDTLSGISSKFGTSINQLCTWNNISNPNLIYAGNTIRVR